MNKHPFIENKYTRWYFKLVSNPFSEDGYSETHHIIPKAMGGDNSKTNLVRLSARQHFIAHKLLTKMTSGLNLKKAMAALRCISIMKSPLADKTLRFLSAKDYEVARSAHAEYARSKMLEHWASEAFRQKMSTCVSTKDRSSRAKKGRTPEVIQAHRASLLGRKHTEETKAKMREARLKRFAEDPSYREKCKAGLAKGLEATRSKTS